MLEMHYLTFMVMVHGGACMVSCVYDVAVREAVSGFWILDLLLAMHDVTRPPRTSRLLLHAHQTDERFLRPRGTHLTHR